MCRFITTWAITLCGVILILSICGAQSATSATRPPNVILIITDDQGYGDLSCHGNPWLQTPELDRLHGESVRLTNFHVSPTCAPTRAALLTARYNNRTTVWHTIMGRSLLHQREETLAEVLRDAGYATGMFGKWHLGDNHGLRPYERGFQHCVAHGGGGVGQTPDFWGNDYFDDTYFVNGTPTRFDGYCTDVWFNEAVRFIEAQRDAPFFVYLSTNAPHGPFHVDPKYSAPFANNKEIVNANFLGMIANIDENIGKLDRKLGQLRLKENTIFIFMTDNGTAAGFDPATGKGFNAGMRGRKASHYEGGHRVPCFLRWPENFKAAQDISQITAHIDIMPTLMELCGAKRGGDLPLDGKSLVPLLLADSQPWPERVLVVDNQRESFPQKFKEYAVMTDRWRLCGNAQEKALFDMKLDPGQQDDLSQDFPEIVKRLSNAYSSWWNSQEADYVIPQPIEIGAQDATEKLTAHDWHSYDSYHVWNQSMIRQGPRANGPWLVNVHDPGTFEFRLRRWPTEADAPINKDLPMQVTRARLSIRGASVEGAVDQDAREAVLSMPLTTGNQMIDARFLSNDGESIGAYYVYVRRIDAKKGD